MGLYAGYVKNFNAIEALIATLMADSAANAHALSELVRRKSFEFGGMRLHELYFSQFEGPAANPDAESGLGSALVRQFGSIDAALEAVRQCALMRGPGWSLLYFDAEAGVFHVGFSGEQHQGHFATLPVLLALDVWEHTYILDYGAAGKAKYVDAFFKNVNWSVVETRFAALG